MDHPAAKTQKFIVEGCIVKMKWFSRFLERERLVWAELDAAIFAPGLGCLARFVIDDAHHAVLEDHATLHGVRLATVHAEAATHAFLLVNARPLFCARVRSSRHEIRWGVQCNKPGDIRAKQGMENEF
jgi:hypothetical protein